jgi:hypothetical protein
MGQARERSYTHRVDDTDPEGIDPAAEDGGSPGWGMGVKYQI